MNALDGTLHLRGSIEATAFWAAIVLPLAYVPLLADGLGTTQEGGLFAAVLVFHLVALRLGHTYGR